MLPTDSAERKTYPIWRGLFVYFPDALPEVAHVSYIANQQHNPGEEMHWAKEKSTDEEDALLRHMVDRIQTGPFDTDGLRHKAKAAWRALAALQREIEEERERKEHVAAANAILQEEDRQARWEAALPLPLPTKHVGIFSCVGCRVNPGELHSKHCQVLAEQRRHAEIRREEEQEMEDEVQANNIQWANHDECGPDCVFRGVRPAA